MSGVPSGSTPTPERGGPLVPYNITGQLNLHPRAAMQFRAGEDPDNYLKFYDEIVADI